MKPLRLPAALPLILVSSLGFAQVHPHNFDLLDVKWHVDLKGYEDTGLLTGDVVNTMTVLSKPSSVSFDCAKLSVKKVLVDGKPATFQLDSKYLTVNLPGVGSGQTVRIHVFYEGHPEAGMYLVPAERAFPAHTNVIYTQGEMEDNRYWLPTWDYPDDKATSEGTIEVNPGEIAVSNGKLLGIKEQSDRRVFHWKMDKPHATYLISIVAGKYDRGSTGTWGNMPVNYYVPQGLIDEGTATFGHTERIIDFYSKLTGFKYPYAKFCQSAVPDYMFGGMENITAVTQTIGALHPPSTEPLTDSTGLVAHELAHQWFGDTVTCNGWSDAWLNEGFATFLPTFWERQRSGPEAYDLGRYGTFQGGLAAHTDTSRPVVWKGYKNALDMFNNFIYPGGASRMFMLMDQLGEARFWKAITSYLNERKYTSVDTPMFFDSMSRATGVNLKPFMKQWFYTSAAPNLTVSEKGKNLLITQPKPYFDLNLDVWVLNGGSWVKKKAHTTGAETVVRLGSLAHHPALVDPRCFVMANIHNSIPLTSAQAIQLFNAAPNAGEKARIMDTMMDGLSNAEWLAFVKTLKSVNMLERTSGHLHDPVDEAFLVGKAHSTDARVRNWAISNLEYQSKSPAVLTRLTEASESDANPLIRETAMQALLKLTNDPGLAEKAWSMDGFRDSYRSMALSWWNQNAKDKARDMCLSALSNPTPEPTRVAAIQYLGNLKDKPGETTVYDALTAVLKETSFGARNAAIYSLASYGNPQALTLIRPFQTHSLVFFRNAADYAVSALNGK